MMIHSVPAEVMCDPALNLTSILERRCADSSNPVIYRWQKSPGNWQPVRAQAFRSMVVAVAKGLIASGVEPGDRVAIMCRTRFEWTVLDFALWYAGAVSIPIYETNAPAQVAYPLEHAEVKAIFVENDKLAATVEAAHEFGSFELEHTWVIDNGALDSLIALGVAEGITDEQVEASRAFASGDDLATIVYTSGTTGKPKGCPLTHGNFLNLSVNTKLVEPEIANPSNSLILFLPLAHVLARLIEVLALDAGVVVGHSPNIKNLASDLDSFKPTFLLVVPRVFEKVYEGAMAKAAKGGTANQRIFERSVDIAVRWSQAKVAGRVPFKLAAQYKFYDALVYSKLRAAMGGKLKYAVSGGGPLGVRLNHFFHAVGIEVVEGYGLTETCAPIAAGRIRDFQIGSIGPLLPGAEGRIAEDGELEVRGVGVIRGYYKNPEEDAVAFTEDGWFRTGDLARFDEQGLLKIVGRKKEIIVTAGGKNVIPAIAENHLRTSPLVSQAMLVGDEKPFISALVTLDPDTLPDQLEHLGLPRSLAMAEAAVNPVVREAIQRIVDEANQLVSRAEAIREFRIMSKDLTEEDGYLTPSQKVKRAKVLADFQAYVDDMYGKVAATPTGERLKEAVEQASERLGQAREQLAEQFEQTREQLEAAREQLTEAREQLAEQFEQTREAAAERFEEAREQFNERLQEYRTSREEQDSAEDQ